MNQPPTRSRRAAANAHSPVNPVSARRATVELGTLLRGEGERVAVSVEGFGDWEEAIEDVVGGAVEDVAVLVWADGVVEVGVEELCDGDGAVVAVPDGPVVVELGECVCVVGRTEVVGDGVPPVVVGEGDDGHTPATA